MRGFNSNDIRSGRLACSLTLIASLLLIRYCYCYIRSYAMPLEVNETQVEETITIEDIEIINGMNEAAEEIIESDKAAYEEAEAAQEQVERTEYDIPSSFVNPVTGKTVSYKGGKTIERSSRITYGEAGEINRLATPDQDGFMKLDNRYLIAVGSRFDTEPGQYMDLVLENGMVIQCIMGDLKADQDTDSTNTFTYHSRCCSEFIIDKNTIRSDIYQRGNASLKMSMWDSPVVTIVVYEDFYEEA
ncbi:hypothetical protein [Pseudobutyrivibrio ruminis]|uniref:hypothetical protein n=1 Tax=Pseudobutyrivibrio ruminis TaxID=46206 RepID=UPI0012DF0CFD|nr:hypothetical protein [Pseudobutyrivibrio ruminis]